jgi:hypothetical protein
MSTLDVLTFVNWTATAAAAVVAAAEMKENTAKK